MDINTIKFCENIYNLSHLTEDKPRALITFIKNHILNKPGLKKDIVGNAGISPLKRRIDAAWSTSDYHLKSENNLNCTKNEFIQELCGDDDNNVGGMIKDMINMKDRKVVLDLCNIYLNAYNDDGLLIHKSDDLDVNI